MSLFELDKVRPEIAESAWVAPGAALIGKVRLAPDASIWFGAVLRGDNEWITIGAGSNVQDLSICHTDMGFALSIGENCTIGHKAIVHGCTIGTCSLLGMGAIVLNGAKIGSHCLIGAGALIPEGKEIADGSLVVGVPGKIVRFLSDEERAGLEKSAKSYQANARRFRAGLREVKL